MSDCSRCGAHISENDPPSIFEAARVIAADTEKDQRVFLLGVACGCQKAVLTKRNLEAAHGKAADSGGKLELYRPEESE